jgi:Apea-like HEPN
LSEEDLRQPYLEREAAYFLDDLPIDILVPLALTKFDCDTTPIGPGVVLERMDDPTQLARVPSPAQFGVHDVVLDAATHAIVLTNWTSKRESLNGYGQQWFWPTETIDGVIAAFRMVSEVETGYAQLLMRPLGWSHGWKADLPPLMRGPSVRRYPPHFENHFWLSDDIPTFDSTFLPVVGVANRLLKSARNPVPMAARRLNSAALRELDEDALIDACIGLEALFGDRGGEITYKLSLRLAAVAARSPLRGLDMSPTEIFRMMKKIYEYRSRLVHGDRNAEDRRMVELSDGSSTSVPRLAVKFLRHSLLSVLEHPDLARPERVDFDLVLPALTREIADSLVAGDVGVDLGEVDTQQQEKEDGTN